MTISSVLLFVFGEFTKAFKTLLVFIPITTITLMFRSKKNQYPKILKESLKKLIAYLMFIIIAVRIDDLAINALFGWEGTTQLLVCLGLIAKELRQMIINIEKMGYKAPSVLTKRINELAGDEGEEYEEPIIMPLRDESGEAELAAPIEEPEKEYSEEQQQVLERLRRLRQIQDEMQETLDS